MFRLRTHSFLVLFAVVARAEDHETLLSQATAAYQAQDYGKSAQLFEAAVKAGTTAPEPPYSAACCYALLGKPDDAFAWLEKAIDMGMRNTDYLRDDADLKSLHADPRWDGLVTRCQKEREKSLSLLKEPALREELLKRMKEDQRIRTTPSPNMREWRKIDGDNTAFMKTVIEEHGWPGKSMVGHEGSLAAYLLVQHADADVEFQKRCLELLTKAVEQKEALAEHMAYLTDRVLVWEGKPQRYGTQFSDTRFLGLFGELKLQPIEDEANVDARRKEVGLPPLAEYVKQMREMQQP